MPNEYSKEHIKQMTDPKHDQSPFKKPKIFESPDGVKLYTKGTFISHIHRENLLKLQVKNFMDIIHKNY